MGVETDVWGGHAVLRRQRAGETMRVHRREGRGQRKDGPRQGFRTRRRGPRPPRDDLNLVVQRPHSDSHWHRLAQIKVRRHNDSRKGQSARDGKVKEREAFGTNKGSAQVGRVAGAGAVSAEVAAMGVEAARGGLGVRPAAIALVGRHEAERAQIGGREADGGAPEAGE